MKGAKHASVDSHEHWLCEVLGLYTVSSIWDQVADAHGETKPYNGPNRPKTPSGMQDSQFGCLPELYKLIGSQNSPLPPPSVTCKKNVRTDDFLRWRNTSRLGRIRYSLVVTSLRTTADRWSAFGLTTTNAVVSGNWSFDASTSTKSTDSASS